MQAIHIKPQLATLVDATPNTNEWLHEVKYDGYRLIAVIKNHSVKLFTRNKKDWTDKFPQIVTDLKKFPNCILDGELVALDKGLSHFELLQNEIANPQATNIHYKVFDILYFQNKNVMNLSLIDRKKILAGVFKPHKNALVSPTDYVIGNGIKVFKKACKLGLEGIVSKRLDSIYQQKRTQTWTKSKCVHEEEFVIAGFTQPSGSRKYFGALVLGYYQNKQLIYCGHVGTGFNQSTLEDLFKKMRKLALKRCPFNKTPPIGHEKVTWIKPKLVAEIKYSERTKQGILRAPSFLGLRLDKASREVKAEMSIQITHAKNIIKPTKHVTKEQIVDYYTKISAYILPYLKNRPLSLFRCPASGSQCFYQKNVTTKDLASLKKIIIQEHGKKIHYVCANKKLDLIHLAQAGVIELHPWGSSKPN
ncbi:MAG: DNA ligase D, partial [Gammaproteobacteria bacterium]